MLLLGMLSSALRVKDTCFYKVGNACKLFHHLASTEKNVSVSVIFWQLLLQKVKKLISSIKQLEKNKV